MYYHNGYTAAVKLIVIAIHYINIDVSSTTATRQSEADDDVLAELFDVVKSEKDHRLQKRDFAFWNRILSSGKKSETDTNKENEKRSEEQNVGLRERELLQAINKNVNQKAKLQENSKLLDTLLDKSVAAKSDSQSQNLQQENKAEIQARRGIVTQLLRAIETLPAAARTKRTNSENTDSRGEYVRRLISAYLSKEQTNEKTVDERDADALLKIFQSGTKTAKRDTEKDSNAGASQKESAQKGVSLLTELLISELSRKNKRAPTTERPLYAEGLDKAYYDKIAAYRPSHKHPYPLYQLYRHAIQMKHITPIGYVHRGPTPDPALLKLYQDVRYGNF